MITRTYKAITARPIVMLAVLLAAGLLFLMQGGLLQAQVASETFYHHEKDTGPVVTLSASDPERVTPIVWSLPAAGADPDGDGELVANDTQDNGDFKINAAGELSFGTSPDYETPADDGANNTYNAVVQASDGGVTTWVEYFKVTVTVLDIEETGDVEWTVDPDGTTGTEPAEQDLLEFQAGAILTAAVTDPDGDDGVAGGGTIADADFAITNVTTWRWYRSSSMSARGTVITKADGDPEDTATYNVSDEAYSNDVGMYLRVVATYTDRRGRSKTAEFVSPHRVQPAKVQANSLPEFAPTSIDREVQEGGAGRNVGAPVTATDADGDVRNYTLGGNDATKFEIDQETGQIKTLVVLNYEADANAADNCVAKNECEVTVHATDSAGGESATDATVTITLLDVNEAPTFGAVSATATPPENILGMAADRPEEGVGNTWTAPYTVSTYTATDPEGVVLGAGKWSLSGDDAALFQLTGAADGTRMLEFREKADFEMPKDAGTNNIYEVTVVASDGEEMAERAVTVKITDSDEAGMITLLSENPVTGTAIMATLEDSDGDVINRAWQWHALDAADDEPTSDNAIEGATTNSYTPVPGDIGMHLVAVVRYMDRTEDEDNNDANHDYTDPTATTYAIRFNNMAASAVTAPVIDDPANARPEFEEGDRAVRYVEERSEADGEVRTPAETIGAPLAIDDDDLPEDSHTFMLSGTDADSFDIMAGTGQLMTKPDVMLNYETKMTYTVIVTVKDGSGAPNDSDRITVTIAVKDLDEKPEIQGEANPEYNEKGMGPVVTLSAADPERVTPIVWSLPTANADPDGDGELVANDTQDNGDFKINAAGELSFGTSPNYEAPADSDTNNTYNAVVRASDGGVTTWVEYFKVTVTVLDIEETGDVEWTVDPDGTTGTEPAEQDLLEFQAGAILTAAVTDPDGDDGVAGGGTIADADFAITNVTTWRWYRSSSMSARGTVITKADGDPEDTATYNVSDETTSNDVGMYLRVVATYTDRRGANKTAEFVSPHRVQPAKVQANSLPEFAPTNHNRRVQEGGAGRNVGAPVTATDADGDVRNYTLGGNDATKFEIDQETGQIKTLVVLNYEADANAADNCVAKNECEVTVHATDSAGGDSATDATVTITLLDVNEVPTFGAVSATATPPENILGMAADRPEEGVGNTWTAPYTVSTYTATDPEGVVLGAGKWSLSGDDAALFQLTGAADGTRMLEFREKADFEMPKDAGTNNIYEVTVVASDGEEMAERAVTVKITDSDEAGMITLLSENPVTGTAIMATLEDSDGDVINRAWQWHALDAADDEPTSDNAIEGATTNSYTPVPGDIGMHLVAVVRYMDRTEDEDNNDANHDYTDPTAITYAIRFDNTVISAATAPVIDDPANARPEFEEGDRAVRYVEERSEADGDVRTPAETIGAPLAIDDDDGVTTTSHSFTLSGTDADSFDIMAGTGQLMTKPDVMLDYETKMTYTVIVTVKDSSNQDNDSDSITVTIQVKDLDEKPEIQKGGLDISGPASVEHVEGDTDAAASYTVTGPMADDAEWSLEGDDAGDFSISGGMLSFRSAPDYENPADADMDNTYMVTVKANDGTYMDDQAVMVMVTNVEELGTLSGLESVIDYAENGTGAVGTYTVTGPMADDADWSLEGDDAGDFSIIGGMLSFTSSPNYENPADADTDNTYMVTVKAEAGGEMDMDTVTINVTDMNEAPMFAPGMDTRSVAENTAAGENVGDPVMAEDEDEGDTLTYALGGGDAASFMIDDETGQISVGEGTELDFESDMTTYTVTVTATDGDGLDDMITVTITVTNVNDQMPMFADDMAEFSVAENAAAGTVVGMVMADDDSSLMYSDDSMYFDVDPETGQIMVAEGAMLDHEMEDMHTVTVTASDGESSDSIMVTIMVTDMNEAPMFAADMDTRSVAENTAAGENVGDLVMAMDEDEGDTLTYALGGDDAASFAIDAATGQIMVGEGTELDFESDMTTYTVTVTATDDDGLYDMITVTITVTNVNEQPMFADDVAEFSVAENAAAGTDVGMVMASDGDDILMFSDDSMYFDVDPETGQIVVAEGAMLDYEMEDMHTVTVTASDGEDTGSITVTITVTDMYPACGTQGGDAANMYLNNDCEALLDSKDALGGSLNWAEDMPINDWDGIQGHSMFPSLSGDPMRVTALHLQKGDLDGMIPDALGRLSALTYLNAHSNTLSGMVPDALGMLTNLERLYLNNNQLDGSIGDLSGATSLEILWLKSNQLTGGIPSELGSLSNLKELRLFNNPDLGGEIPMELGNLSSLTLLVVQDTGLTGEIPMELGNLSNLMWLGLYNNELSGTIPMELGRLSNLEVLYLHYNQLTGEIPDELGNLAALTNLWLKSNLVTGDIPSSLGDLTNLERVRFSRNPGLTGCVPAGLAAVADNDFIHLGLPTCQ